MASAEIAAVLRTIQPPFGPNLNVIAASNGAFRMYFVVRNPRRTRAKVLLETRNGSTRELAKAFPDLAKTWPKPDGKGKLAAVGLVDGRCLDAEEVRNVHEDSVPLELDGGGTRGYTVVGLAESGAAVVHVVQSIEGVEMGGLTVLVLP